MEKLLLLISEIITKKKNYHYYNEKNYHGIYIIFRSKLIIKQISEVYQSLIC